MRRGEVWLADLPPPMGKRPVLLLSRDEAYRVRALVTVAPLTAVIRGIPVEVPLGPAEGLRKVCVANLDTILTIRKTQLTQFISPLSPQKISELNAAVKFALAIP